MVTFCGTSRVIVASVSPALLHLQRCVVIYASYLGSDWAPAAASAWLPAGQFVPSSEKEQMEMLSLCDQEADDGYFGECRVCIGGRKENAEGWW